jgi:hypothetical protein
MAEYRYEGNELAIFAQARYWKQYWISQVALFIKGDVLEVGAGIGSNTMRLQHLSPGRRLCLEPYERLLVELQGEVIPRVAAPIDVARGTVSSLPEDEVFDTALYIDVLEHIPDDVGEIAAVAKHIRSSGHIIVLSPAHQLLYSPFDRAIGHQRRYNRASLRRCTPPNVQSIRVSYLDSVGYCLSPANRLVLRQSSPTLEQILFWDKYILSVSLFIDQALGFRIGKSFLGVWQVSRDRLL